MKLVNAQNLVLIALASLAVGACGPVATSIGKATGIGGGNTSPTESLSADGQASTGTAAVESTDVVKEDDFKASWPKISVKPTMLIATNELVEVKESFLACAPAELKSPENSKIKGAEGTLSGPKSKIHHYLVVKSETDIAKLRLSDLKMSIKWIAPDKDSGEKGHWDLSIVSPPNTGDPAKDTDAENIRKALVQQLIGVAVQFDAEG